MGFYEWQQRCFQYCNYKPTPEQWRIHRDPHRKKLVCGGVRGGKSHSGAMEMVSRCIEGKLFWLVGHDYEATRGEWEHLIVMLDMVHMISGKPSTGIDPGVIHLVTGGKIITKSAKYPRTLATVAPDGIILCEAAQTDYETYLRLDERIAEKRAWLYMSGTLEYSEDWYSEFYHLWETANEDGASFSLPTWANTHKFPGGRQDKEILRIERGTHPDRFMERYGGIPCPPSNRIAKEFANRLHVIPSVVYDPNLPVEIAVDPGYRGAYSILALQKLGESVIVFDEIYLQGLVSEEMITIAKQKPWWRLVNSGVIDIAAKAHHSEVAPIEIWRHKAELQLDCNKVNEEDGIDLLRTYLTVNPISKQPIIAIAPRCKGLISELGGCKSPIEGGGTWKRNMETRVPIDRDNHSAKALIYWLADRFGYTDARRVHRKVNPFRLSSDKVRRRET